MLACVDIGLIEYAENSHIKTTLFIMGDIAP